MQGTGLALGADDDHAARLLGAPESLRSDPVDAVQERLATQFFGPARERLGADAWDAPNARDAR